MIERYHVKMPISDAIRFTMEVSIDSIEKRRCGDTITIGGLSQHIGYLMEAKNRPASMNSSWGIFDAENRSPELHRDNLCMQNLA